jgi:hypothetical protein
MLKEGEKVDFARRAKATLRNLPCPFVRRFLVALPPLVTLAVALAHRLPASFPPGGAGDGDQAHSRQYQA